MNEIPVKMPSGGEIIVTSPNKEKVAIYVCHRDKDDHAIYFGDVKSQKVEAILKLNKSGESCQQLVISNDNQSLITRIWRYGEGDILSVYNIKSSFDKTKALVCIQKIRNTVMLDVKTIPHTNLIAILNEYSNRQNNIQILNTKTNKCLRSFEVPRCKFMEFFANETLITVGHHSINRWDLKDKSGNPIHSIETKDEITQVIKISDTRLLVQEGAFIKIYDINSLECIKSTPLKEPFKEELHNLDNRHFMSMEHSPSTYTGCELNLFRLSDNNDFKRLPTQYSPSKVSCSPRDSINFMPDPEVEGKWLCVIGSKRVQTIHFYVNNDVTSENKCQS